ncbi:MAG: ABC transporter substrate-binding protein, partial [Desulfobacteraceae bacterium]
MRFMHSAYKTLLFFLCILFLIPGFSFGSDSAKITDSAGNHLVFTKKPERVVCLRAYITEIIYRFGEGKCITGLTKQDLGLNPTSTAKNVGSYFYPDIKAIIDCKPDLIIAAPSHKKIIDYFKDKPCRIMVLKENSINDAFIQMEMISKIFNCLPEARKVIESNREKLAIVKARADKIPNEKRKRVVRVMAGTGISCPGDDSFQMEMIKAAGGIPLKTGKNGFAVQVGLKQWQDFNPQFIYGCNDNKKAVTELINRKGWKDVDAVKNGSVTMFPCRLTCQVSTNIGDFIQWLAATVYLEDFADQDKAATEDTVLEKTLIKVDVPYLKNTEIVRHRVADAEYKSLVVNFKTKQDIASTFEGNLSNLIAAGNTYVPMHASLGQMAFGVDRAKAAIKKNLGFNENEFTTLMTGADMDNLSIQKRTYKDLEVTALVTAGVRGNALRASK